MCGRYGCASGWVGIDCGYTSRAWGGDSHLPLLKKKKRGIGVRKLSLFMIICIKLKSMWIILWTTKCKCIMKDHNIFGRIWDKILFPEENCQSMKAINSFKRLQFSKHPKFKKKLCFKNIGKLFCIMWTAVNSKEYALN